MHVLSSSSILRQIKCPDITTHRGFFSWPKALPPVTMLWRPWRRQGRAPAAVFSVQAAAALLAAVWVASLAVVRAPLARTSDVASNFDSRL